MPSWQAVTPRSTDRTQTDIYTCVNKNKKNTKIQNIDIYLRFYITPHGGRRAAARSTDRVTPREDILDLQSKHLLLFYIYIYIYIYSVFLLLL